MKSLQRKTDEQLNSLDLISSEQRSWGDASQRLQLLTVSRGAALSPSLWWQRRGPREWHGAVPEEGYIRYLEIIFHQRVLKHWNRLTTAVVMAPRLLEFNKHLGKALKAYALIFGLSYVEPGVGLEDPHGFLPTWYIWLYERGCESLAGLETSSWGKRDEKAQVLSLRWD